MIEMHLIAGRESRDIAECEWRGQRYTAASSHGAAMALARQLVAAGAPDQPWCVPGRLHGRSLHGLARLTVTETDGGVRFGLYDGRTREKPAAAALQAMFDATVIARTPSRWLPSSTAMPPGLGFRCRHIAHDAGIVLAGRGPAMPAGTQTGDCHAGLVLAMQDDLFGNCEPAIVQENLVVVLVDA